MWQSCPDWFKPLKKHNVFFLTIMNKYSGLITNFSSTPSHFRLMGLLFTDENTRIKNLSFSYANQIVVIFFLADKTTDFLVSGEPFLLHLLHNGSLFTARPVFSC